VGFERFMDKAVCESNVCAVGSTSVGVERTVPHQGQVLAVLVGALVVGELVKDVVFSVDRGEWLPACEFVYYGMIACLPFLLAKWAPEAARFGIQWLPDSRRQWAWFLGLVFLLFLLKAMFAAVAVAIVGDVPPRPEIGPNMPAGIVSVGIAMIVVAPIAEEIFFRGYVLEQLRKLTYSGMAVFTQALLFGLCHAYTRGLFTWYATFDSVLAFATGLALGVWRVRFRSLLPLVLAHILLNATSVVPLKARYDYVTAKSDPIQHTVSEETTHITEPLRPDGSVDYVAALNGRYRQGVTPRNNAAVLFWKAVGPKEIRPEYRTKYFTMLGIRPLREKGDYFVELDDFLVRRLSPSEADDGASTAEDRWDASGRLDRAGQCPWARQKFPVLAEWLVANEGPLALLVEASRRPRRFDPLCCRVRTPVDSVPRPALIIYREVSRAFCARAMLGLEEGKPAEAWEDLLVCHRLARLVGQGQTTNDVISGVGIEERACLGDRALLRYARLSVDRIATMRKDLDQLSPMPRMVERVDSADRYGYLDNVSDSSREGVRAVAEACQVMVQVDQDEFGPLQNTFDLLGQHADDFVADWDSFLREGNGWYDRIVEAYGKSSALEREKALREVEEDLDRLKDIAADVRSLREAMRDNASDALSERLGVIQLTFFVPDPTLYAHMESRGLMWFELVKVGFALAAYRSDHGAYPARLSDLEPDYIAKVPEDVFSDSPLRYRCEGEGYLLYSVGVNGSSDGARGYDDRRNGEDWDDLVIRVPGGRGDDGPR